MCYTRPRDTRGAFPKRLGEIPRRCSARIAKADGSAHRTVTNQRSSTEEDLAMVLGLEKQVNKKRGVYHPQMTMSTIRNPPAPLESCAPIVYTISMSANVND